MAQEKQRENRTQNKKGPIAKTLALCLMIFIFTGCVNRDAKMAALQIQIIYLEHALEDCRKDTDESEALLNGCEKILDDLQIGR